MAEKSCSGCGASKPIDQFSVDRRRADGRNVYCFVCSRSRNRASYERNKAREAERKRKTYLENRDAVLARNRRWRDANREKEREQHREYYRANPDVFLRRGTNRKAAFAAIEKFQVTKRDLERTLARFDRACAYCLERLELVTWDHVVPVSRGGAHCVGNLVPACRSCNSAKNARTLTEWRKSRG